MSSRSIPLSTASPRSARSAEIGLDAALALRTRGHAVQRTRTRARLALVLPLAVALGVPGTFGPTADAAETDATSATDDTTTTKTQRPRPGDVLAAITGRDLDGQEHSVTRSTDGDPSVRLTVLVFNGVGCPIAELYGKRIARLAEQAPARGVRVLGVNSNAQDTTPEIRAYANRHRISFPILKDHDHSIADLLGAERTTEAFVIETSTGRLLYRGRVDDQYAIDDERSVGLRKDHPEAHYLRDAVEAALAGRAPSPAETPALGCVIGRRRVVADGASVTFHRDVEPILQTRCQSCHRPGEIGPFPLLDHEDAAGWAGMIREVVENRRMPPWHADERHRGDFSNDRSLGEEEIATILRWVDDGAPAGDPADRPPPREFSSGWSFGEPDAEFAMPRGFRVPASGSVDYQYFQIPTSFDEDRWVRAIEVRAGERSVVHHVLVFAVDPRNPRRWRRETELGVRGYFGIMVPGEQPTEFPEGAAKRLPAGATLVFQVHYTPSGEAVEDRSRIGLWFADASAVRHEVRTSSLARVRGLVIPPNTERHRVVARSRLSEETRILSLLPHMHLRGESFRYEALYPASVSVSAEPDWEKLSRATMAALTWSRQTGHLESTGGLPEGALEELRAAFSKEADRRAAERLFEAARTEVLLDVPKYDFGWQGNYRFVEPKVLPAGTILVCTATYNNSASNPALTEELWSRRVRWGDQTDDEMFIGYFDLLVPR